MTYMKTAEDAIRLEVERRIMALTPHYRANRPLRRYQPRDDTPIREFTGAARFFDIAPARQVSAYRTGYDSSGLLYEMPITIVYRSHRNWQTAAADDVVQITHDLLNTSGAHGVSGVANRHIDPNTPTAIEKAADDPWEYHTLRMLVWFEISH